MIDRGRWIDGSVGHVGEGAFITVMIIEVTPKTKQSEIEKH
jgi:hypothetical protein